MGWGGGGCFIEFEWDREVGWGGVGAYSRLGPY